MVDTSRRSGLAGIYIAPRNLDQIGALIQLYCFLVSTQQSKITSYYLAPGFQIIISADIRQPTQILDDPNTICMP